MPKTKEQKRKEAQVRKTEREALLKQVYVFFYRSTADLKEIIVRKGGK